MTQQLNLSNMLTGSLIVSAIGGFLVLVTDFGWLYWYEYYSYGYYSYNTVYVSLFSPAYMLLILGPALGLFGYIIYICSLGIRHSPQFRLDMIDKGYYASMVVLGIFVASGIIFMGVASDYDDWGFDAAFYGGLLGGALSTLFFYMARQQLRTVMGPRYPGYPRQPPYQTYYPPQQPPYSPGQPPYQPPQQPPKEDPYRRPPP